MEVLVAVLLLAIAIAPMMLALTPPLRGVQATEQRDVCVNCALYTLTRITALDYAVLYGNKSSSVDLTYLLGGMGQSSSVERDAEVFSLSGTSYTPAVSIANYVDPVSSLVVTGALQIAVTVGPVRLTALRTDY